MGRSFRNLSTAHRGSALRALDLVVPRPLRIDLDALLTWIEVDADGDAEDSPRRHVTKKSPVLQVPIWGSFIRPSKLKTK